MAKPVKPTNVVMNPTPELLAVVNISARSLGTRPGAAVVGLTSVDATRELTVEANPATELGNSKNPLRRNL